MSRNYVISTRKAMLYAGHYENGTRKPGLSLTWNTSQRQPPSIKQMQMNGMRKVPITLAKIPESRVLTKEELE